MPLVRNHLYSQSDYHGKLIDAPDPFCPCRLCWHVYHFPFWDSLGRRHDNFDCVTHASKGCPDPLPKPIHVFYNSKRFQNRKGGDKFRCLRCNQLITFGFDDFDYIVVPFRRRRQVLEFLNKIEKES